MTTEIHIPCKTSCPVPSNPSLAGRLDRLESKLDKLQDALLVLARMEERSIAQAHWNEQQRAVQDEINARLTAVERFQWKMAGVLVVLSLVAGWVIPELTKRTLGGM